MGWQQAIKNLEIPEKSKTCFSSASIKKVEVSRKNKCWIIYLELPQLVPSEDLQQFKNCILSNYHECIQQLHVKFVCKQPENLAVLCSNYWGILIDFWEKELSCLKVWKEFLDYEVDGNTLCFYIANKVGLEILRKKGFTKFITQWFQEKFLLHVNTKLEYQEISHQSSTIQNVQEKIYRNLVNINKNAKSLKNDKSTDEAESNSNIIWGQEIRQNPTHKIKELVTEEDKIIVKGKIFNIEKKELKKFTLVTFDITDKTDSISVKIFTNEKKNLQRPLNAGDWVLVKGRTEIDRFSNELVLMPTAIMITDPIKRIDNAPEKRIELHLHTKMSALDGLTDIDRCIAQVAEWGHKAVAITDHGVVQGFPEAYEAGQKHGVKIIYGLEGYFFNDEKNGNENERYHIIMLAKNYTGLKNLYKLVTLSHLKYFYRKPRIPKSELVKHREGLIIGSACEAGELIQKYLKGAEYEELLNIASFYDYLEIQPTGNNSFMIREGIVNSEQDLQTLNKIIVDLANDLGKPVVATGDVHFLEPEDAYFREILMAGQGFKDEEQPPLYLKPTEEMLKEFNYLGEETARKVVIENPQKIAEQIEDLKPIPDELYPPSIPGAEDQIKNMAISNAKEIYGDPLPEIVEKRLEKELNSIINNGFAVLYLIAHKLVKKSNEDGYLVGSRGSVGSSFVATMTGITEVNPLVPHYVCPNCKKSVFITDGSYNCGVDMPDKKCDVCGTQFKKDGHNIPFEVFLGFKGDKVPDIDLNFSGEYQPEAHKFTEKLFGSDHVFRAGTIATIAKKTAFGFVKNFCDDRNISVKNAEMNRLVEGCTGVKRTTGQHPGGLMVVPQDMDVHQFTPLQRPADDVNSTTITTHFDYHAISSRLVKLDILGHDDPTVIKMLEDFTGIDAKKIPLDDQKTMSIFSDVESLGLKPEDINSPVGTFGIPEFGTRFVRGMLEETRPKTFSELVRISGFSHGTDVWLNNAQELIRSGTATLSEAIACRDDIMTYLLLKGLPPDKAFRIMEDVRKGKGLKSEYLDLMVEKGVPQWYIESCKKIKYMFPKAHAVAYVTMAFRIAYFKVNYPEAFYATFFTVKANEFDADLIVQGEKRIESRIEEIERLGNNATAKEKSELTILEVALEMYKRGIRMCRVDLEKSFATKFQITANGLLPPFVALQGLGENAAKNIVKAREEQSPFKSKEDLQKRARLTKTVMEVLEAHGTLKGLPETSQLAFF